MSRNINFIFKIPSAIRLIYFLDNKTLIVFKDGRVFVQKLNINLLICKKKNIIYITDNYLGQSKNNIKSIRSDTLFQIKSFISNKKFFFYKKLFLKGIGYRFIVKCDKRSLLQLMLGFSHSVFVKLPKEIKIFLIRPDLLFITSSNYLKLNLLTQSIKSLKVPEAYKGKGINFEYNKIILKEGKKSQ